jgi:hypothetical protein
MEDQNEKLRDSCNKAYLCFKKINDPADTAIQSKLEFVIGSYDFDKNPIGLYEIGKLALPILKKIKIKSPRKVTKQLITDLEKSLATK